MPSLTTQSIGVVGAPLANARQATQLARASQAGVQAGLQHAENALRAVHSATKAQQSAQRSIQAETRAEGAFEEQSNKDSDSQTKADVERRGTSRIDRIA